MCRLREAILIHMRQRGTAAACKGESAGFNGVG